MLINLIHTPVFAETSADKSEQPAIKEKTKKKHRKKSKKTKKPSLIRRGTKKVIEKGQKIVNSGAEKVEGTRDILTEKIFLISSSIDEFFSDEHSLDRNNRSYVKLSLRSVAEKYEKTDTDFLISSRLSLPNIQKNLHLIFNSEEEDSEDDAKGSNTDVQNDKDTSYQAGLRYDFFSLGGFKTNLDGGLKLKDPLDPFLKFRIQKELLRLYFQYKFIQTFKWFKTEGYGSDTEFYMDHPFSPKVLFRIYSGGRWREGGDEENSSIWTLHHNWSVIHFMGLKQALTYQVGANGTDEPEVHINSWVTSIGLRTLAYKDWLYLTVQPALVWRKEDSFKTRTQITVRLDMILGDTPFRQARSKYF